MASHLTKEEAKAVSYDFEVHFMDFSDDFQLFKKFDNGNGILSLAEVDRAIIHWYPEFGTNRQAMLRAFKAADTNNVHENEVLFFLHKFLILFPEWIC